MFFKYIKKREIQKQKTPLPQISRFSNEKKIIEEHFRGFWRSEYSSHSFNNTLSRNLVDYSVSLNNHNGRMIYIYILDVVNPTKKTAVGYQTREGPMSVETIPFI